MGGIKKNFAYNLAYQVLAFAIPLITAPYLSRVLGASGVGEYAYGYNIAYYLGLLAQLGLSRYGTREIAAVRASKGDVEQLFWELFWLQAALTAIVSSGYVIFILVGNAGPLAPLWIPFLISYGLDLTWLYNGEENFRITVIRNSLVKLMMLVGVLLFVNSIDDVWVYVTISSAGQLISQIVALPYCRDYVHGFSKPEPLKSIKHVVPTLILFLPTIATSVYRTLDKVMLGAMCTSEQLGFFDSSEKIIMVPLGVISALSAVMLPRITGLLSKGKTKETHRYIHATMFLSCFLSFGMFCGIVSVAASFVPIYFGSSFEPCVQLISLLSVTVPFIAWACVIREQYLIPAGRYREYIISVLAGAVCNVFINVLIMPKLGALGASIAMVITEILVCVMLTKEVFRELNLFETIKDILPFAILSIMVIVIGVFIRWVISSNVLSFFVGLLVAGGSYLLGAYCICRASKRVWPLIKVILGDKLYMRLGFH